LADGHRQLGNALRDFGKPREARDAYDQAAKLHQGLLNESPADARYKTALANTLLNMVSLLPRRDHAEALEPIYRRIVELDRAAGQTAPGNANFSSELALALLGQGLLFLDTDRRYEAEAAIREALEIHQRLLKSGRLKGYVERYVARSFAGLGLVLA